MFREPVKVREGMIEVDVDKDKTRLPPCSCNIIKTEEKDEL